MDANGLSGPLGRDFNPLAATAATSEFAKRINHIYEENTGPDLLWLPLKKLLSVPRTAPRSTSQH
jgi:hypothetical protein